MLNCLAKTSWEIKCIMGHSENITGGGRGLLRGDSDFASPHRGVARFSQSSRGGGRFCQILIIKKTIKIICGGGVYQDSANLGARVLLAKIKKPPPPSDVFWMVPKSKKKKVRKLNKKCVPISKIYTCLLKVCDILHSNITCFFYHEVLTATKLFQFYC